MLDKIIKINYWLIPAALFFIISNSSILVLSYLLSGNLFIETIKLAQFLFLLLLLLTLNINKYLKLFFINIIYFSYAILVLYYFNTKVPLDFSFLKRNLNNIDSLIPEFYLLFLITLIVIVINSFTLHKISEKLKLKKVSIIILLLIMISPLLLGNKLNNEVADNEITKFIKSIYRDDPLLNYYEEKIYASLIQASINNRDNVIAQTAEINKDKLPKYLDNIIFLQLENLNSYLVNEKVTPNFINLSKEGVFFPEFYSNSVQTILGQENILCSLPSSFDLKLVNSNLGKEILCLPEIFNNLGYKTFFIKSYRLDFDKTDQFTANLKFEETHADDIMKSDDPKYSWGWREDIFYKRAFDYLKNHKKKNNFIYLEIGPTNHWPFATRDEFKNSVPYQNPKNHQEKLTNTTYLQDSYLKEAINRINRMFPEKNYTIFILGDHSWPAEIHEKNTFNQKDSFEENFLTSMIVILGDEEKYKNKIIKKKYNHLDIMPSLLEMFKLEPNSNQFKQSFWGAINSDNELNVTSKTLLIQPYSDKFINIISNNLKYQYNSQSKNFTIYNLKEDALEKNGNIIGNEREENIKILKELTNF